MKAQVVEQINIAEAKMAITQTAELYFAKDRNGAYKMDRRRARPVCLMGPAGIGKTEIVKQVADEKGLAFLSYSITHHTRQSAIGLPRLSSCEIGGHEVSVTEYTMSEIIAEVYRIMRETGKTEGILFLDEFNCASETLRPIMLQLLQSKTFGPHAIPDGWMLVLAGNPAEYNASARALDAVTADRLRLLWLRPDYSAWREYMIHSRIHPIVLSYLDDHRKHFYVFEKGNDGTGLVTARGWEDLSVMLRMMEEHGFEINLPFVAQYIQSAQVAREFLSYYQLYSSLIESGIADGIFNGNPTKEQRKQLVKFGAAEKFALTSIMLMRLEHCCEQADEELSGADPKALAKAKAEAGKALEKVLSIYDELLSDGPQLEFLISGITNSDVIAMYIARNGSAAYNKAASQFYFADESTPSVKKLKAMMNGKAA